MKQKSLIFLLLTFAAPSGCSSKGISLIYDKKSSSDVQGGEAGNWSNDQFLSGKNRCATDFSLSEKEADVSQIEAFCDCLVDKAREKYAYLEYMNDLNNLRDRQAKQGQVAECRKIAKLPALVNLRTWQPQGLFDSDPFYKYSPTVVTLPDNKMVLTYGKALNGKNTHFAVHHDGKAWGAPQVIGENYDYGARVAVNKKGQMNAVWAITKATAQGFAPSGIVSTTYDPSTGWQPAVIHRDVADEGYVSNYNNSIDENGNAIVTWSVGTPSPVNPAVAQTFSYMRVYSGGAWQDTTTIGAAEYVWPAIVITPDKMMHALVGVGDPVRREVTMHSARVPLVIGRFIPSDFTPLEKFEAEDVISAEAEMKVDTKGNIGAIWFRGTQAAVAEDWRTRVTVANFDAATGAWNLKPNFSSGSTGPVFYTRIGMTPDGTAFAVWVQNEGTRQLIWASRYQAAKGWDTPIPIDHNAAVASSAPVLSVNNKGEAIAVWSKQSILDDNGWITMASHFNGFYWSSETAISSKTAGKVTAFASVSLHEDGSGHAFWTQGDSLEGSETDFMYMAELK